MTELYEYEMGKAGKTLMEEMFQVKQGETVIITADTESDERVVNTAARAAVAQEARPMVIWLPAPRGVGKAADPMLPLDALSAALSEADAWVEFNNQWLLYSTPFEIAMRNNNKLRYLCLVGMDTDMMVRVIGRVNKTALEKFLNRVAEITNKAEKIRITTPSGTDLKFMNTAKHPVVTDTGDASVPGMHMLAGQISWAPAFDTIEGTLVFDGSLTPPCGLLNEQIELTIVKGRITEISGGRQAREFETWLEQFDDPNMFRLAHISYGFNPGAKLTGNILEDERVWGCTEWGLGYLSTADAPPEGIKAKSHCDGICLNSSVWLDGEMILNKGKVVHQQLLDLVKSLRK